MAKHDIINENSVYNAIFMENDYAKDDNDGMQLYCGRTAH